MTATDANPKTLEAIQAIIGIGKGKKPVAKTEEKSSDADTEPDARPSPEEDTQAPEAEPKSKAASRGEQDEDDGEEQASIPHHRFKKVNEALKAERELRKAAEQELARRKQTENEDALVGILEKKKPKGFDDWEPARQTAWVSREVAKETVESRESWERPYLRAAATQLRVQKETGFSPDASQATVIADVLDTNPRLTTRQALLVAADSHPDLFPASGSKKPASHSVLDPAKGGRAPATRDEKGRFAERLAAAPPGTRKALALDHISRLIKPPQKRQ